jgi:hypothetical protein
VNTAWLCFGSSRRVPSGGSRPLQSASQHGKMAVRLWVKVSWIIFAIMLLTLIAPQSSFEAGALAEHLSRSTPIKVPYRTPPNYALIITSTVSIFGLAFLAKFFWPLFAFFVLSRWTWALACILSSLIFTSGYMFTRIRHMPFAQNTRQGPQWIAGGYSNQFGAETYVIATLCMCIIVRLQLIVDSLIL